MYIARANSMIPKTNKRKTGATSANSTAETPRSFLGVDGTRKDCLFARIAHRNVCCEVDSLPVHLVEVVGDGTQNIVAYPNPYLNTHCLGNGPPTLAQVALDNDGP